MPEQTILDALLLLGRFYLILVAILTFVAFNKRHNISGIIMDDHIVFIQYNGTMDRLIDSIDIYESFCVVVVVIYPEK